PEATVPHTVTPLSLLAFMRPASLVPCPPSAGYSHECCMKPRQLRTQSKAAIKNAKSLELGPKDSADHRGLGRSSDERSSSLADPVISPAHAIHRRNDRGIGQRNRHAVETISAATEIKLACTVPGIQPNSAASI